MHTVPVTVADLKGHCPGADFTLRMKGEQIGAYCSICGRWVRWVSKKLIPGLENRGYRIGADVTAPVVVSQAPQLDEPSYLSKVQQPVCDADEDADDDSPPWYTDCNFCDLNDFTEVETATNTNIEYKQGFTTVTENSTGRVLLKIKTTHCPYCGKKLN